MTALVVKIGEARFGITNAFARMPFRFGVVTIEAAASLTLELDVIVEGQHTVGYASDLLAYKWFDKRPEKSPADNVADLLWIVESAADIARDIPPGTVFDLWRQLDAEVERVSLAGGFNRLGASFGTSMIERAVIDAVGRHIGLSLHDMLLRDVLGLRPAEIFSELDGSSLSATLPERPLSKLDLRHTIGLVDPLTAADLSEPVGDGLPETLEDYLLLDGIHYLKIKVAGDYDSDLARLRNIAGLCKNLGIAVQATIDGNEQYRSLDDFAALMDSVRASPTLASLYESTLFIEQPLERSVAMDGPLDERALSTIGKSLLIDEADGWTRAYHDAVQLGYRGVSHKNCKGVFRSFLNAMLTDHYNMVTEQRGSHFMSAEDLTCLPALSLQADLQVITTLGISHVERNGHHYFRGLDHLPASEATAALAAHPDLYEAPRQRVQMAIRNGQIAVGSLQMPGLGSTVLPDMSTRIAPKDWSFAMLAPECHEPDKEGARA